MLAQNFKTAAELEITEPQREALIQTLAYFEQGKLQHVYDGNYDTEEGFEFTGHFNMNYWRNQAPCGTIACIGGTAELIGNVRFEVYDRPGALDQLFFPDYGVRYEEVTTEQAAQAIRSYLTTGEPRWKDIKDLPRLTT